MDNKGQEVNLKNILSYHEAKSIIEIAEPSFERSQVVVHGDSNFQILDARTSSTSYIPDHNREVFSNLEKRISLITKLPPSHIETFQVARYEPGQKFTEHFDFFDNEDQFSSSNRKYTCLIYLNDLKSDDLGGSTEFNELDVKIRPSIGNGIIWANLDKNNIPDYHTLHAGNPPDNSVKYILTAWVREKPYDPYE
jgi:prolyl 4-hydroxylase